MDLCVLFFLLLPIQAVAVKRVADLGGVFYLDTFVQITVQIILIDIIMDCPLNSGSAIGYLRLISYHL